tara:strand:+ start:463 stop:768 length:306 start_codon:yes stop_codon:yes gene_type:complete
MRAARIEDGIVADLWEVPSLTAFEGITLIEVADTVSMGASYDGSTFTNVQPTAEQLQAETNATSQAYLASTDWYITRYAETAVAVPADVTTARAAARAAIV